MARFLVARSALLLWCAIAAALTTSLTCSAHQSDNESRQPIYQLQQQKQSASMQRDHLLTSSIASSLDNREKDIASTASQSRIKSHEGVSRTDAIKTASVRFSNYVSPVSARCYLYNEFTGTTIDFGAVEEKGKSPVQEVPVNPNVQADNVWMVIVNVGTNYSADELLYINSSSPVVSKVLYTVFVYGNVSHDVHMWVNTNETKKQPLEIDQALLNVRNKELNPVDLYQQSSRCGEKCNFTYMGTVLPGEMIGFPINARFSLKFNINYTNEPNELVCSISNYLHFHEGGVYNLTAEVIVNNHSCPHHMNSSGDGMTYFPLLYAAVVILALTLCFVSAGCIYKVVLNRGWLHYLHINAIDRRIARDLGEPKHTSTNYGSTGPETPPSVGSPTEADPLIKGNSAAGSSGLSTAGDLLVQGTADSLKVVTRKRLKSLDAFRGFSLVIMIFVNYGGGGYWFFNHSEWNGLTVADLVFPWFVWIMGVSLVFSFKGRSQSDPFVSRLYQVFRRSVILFCLGLFLNNGFDLARWRIPGVLQRLGISYFVCALTELLTLDLYKKLKTKIKILKAFSDLMLNWVQWLVILLCELLWLALTFGLPLHYLDSNCPRGYIGPGGISDHGHYENCTGGAAALIDKWLLGESHIYRTPTSAKLYRTGPYDPEGVLGSLNSIVICFLGVQAGRILTTHHSHVGRLIRFITWGILLGILGATLCEGERDEGVIPINKNLWSLSFILVMAGTGYLLFSLFYFLIDVIGWWGGEPFKYPGMNSIMVYVGSELLESHFPFSWSGQRDSHLRLLSANLIGVSLWLLIALYCYCIGFFVKI